MEKISVIIPMYNSEKFIQQCVESVICQTYPELEILIIDDGSKDNSLEICRKLRASDERIRILKQEHKGVSAARNQGLEAAAGKYVLFIDSDDMIHPLLTEVFVRQMEERNADLAFCDRRRPDSQEMDEIWGQIQEEKGILQWELAEATESEKWFHEKYIEILPGIGGKMIRRSSIKDLRFNENLNNGEDTLFLYGLVCSGIRITYLAQSWYLYRMHAESIMHSYKTVKDDSYFECRRIIRDLEYEKKYTTFALTWERSLLWAMLSSFIKMKEFDDKEGCRLLKKQAISELRHPLFRAVELSSKVCFLSCIFCNPLYYILRKLYKPVQKIREKRSQKSADIGILTFHCADNYGAMLQSYGLKRYLCNKGIKAELAAYEPPFMTGRHWWFPYVPRKGWKGYLWCICNLCMGWKSNFFMGKNFFRRRANMKGFRNQYLLNPGQKRIFFTSQLKGLPYSIYLVGSDQIWNPDITCGLRKAYFGAFQNKKKEKVIAYAASLGGADLSSEYNEEFAELVRHIDLVSLREREAVPYVEQFYEKPIEVVLDPVFLLERNNWKQIEKPPKRDGYILVYLTEANKELNAYVKALSGEKKLPVVELRISGGATDESFEVECTAGPAEFLGYIHKADYVVTNSFHAVAFSIIYRKPFFAFLHNSRGARVRNILRIHGLEDRLYRKDADITIDSPIDWGDAERQAEKVKKASKDFLMEHVAGAKREDIEN